MNSPFSKKTVLITGAAGFLGRHIIRSLPSDCEIIAVDNQITGGEFVDQSNVHNSTADITSNFIRIGPVQLHYIFHAAGIASPVFYRKYPLETIDVAVKGTRYMLELAKAHPELEGFLYFSSSEIYGDPNVVPTPETYKGNVSCVGPRACYDESKRLGETLCSVYHEHYGVPVKIVRPFNVFGPGMGHNDRRVVPMFTYEAFNGRPLPVFRDGMQTRTFCYVDDAVEGLLQGINSWAAGRGLQYWQPEQRNLDARPRAHVSGIDPRY